MRAELQRLKRDTTSGKKIAVEEPLQPLSTSSAAQRSSGSAPYAAPASSSARVPAVSADPSSSSAAVSAAPGSPASSKKYLFIGAGIVMVAFIVGGLYLRFRGTQKLTEKDPILVADFVNTTGDLVFDGTLKQALAVQLEQSPYFNIVPDQTVRKALQFMGRPADERVTGSVAGELCEREHIKALLSGSITSLGSQYVIALDATNCATGDSLAREQVTASSKEGVLAAVGKAASSIRGKLGESLASVQKFDTPVTEATTSSLEALKAYAAADALRNSGGEAESIPMFQRAIELDPNFAMAYARLSAIYFNLGEEDRSGEFGKKAFNLRERVSDRERFYIDDHYYTTTGDVDKNKEALEAAIRAYPNDYSPLCNLALQYNVNLGQFEKALSIAGRCLQFLPDAPFGYVHTAVPFTALNRLEESRSTLQRAVDAKADNLFVHQGLYEVAYLTNDSVGMQQQLKWADGKPSEYLLVNEEASVAASGGQMRKAEDLIQRSVQITDRLGFKGTTADTKAQLAVSLAEVGETAKAHEMAAASPALARGRSNLVPAAIAMAMTGDVSRAQSIMEELGRRFPDDTILHNVSIPSVAALAAINRKAPEQAIQSLRSAQPYEYGIGQFPLPVYIRALAYLQAKRGSEAAAEFQRIVDHRGIAPVAPEHSLAKLGLGRAYVLAGDTAKAKVAYQDFFALWKDADSDGPLLKDARAEYAKLQ